MNSASTGRDVFQAFLSEEIVPLAARFGYAVRAVRVADVVELTLEHGRGRLVVWVRPGDDSSRCYRKTAQFGIGYSGAPADPSALALLDALAERIASWERSVGEDACRQVFALRRPRDASPASAGASALDAADTRELLAVRAGLKPACRHLLRRDRAHELAERARRDGLHVRITEAAAFAASCCGEGVAEHATTLVHVGRTEPSAEAAAAAEQSMIDACARGERVSDAQVRALGVALGYPACCIEAFLPIRDDLSTADIRFHALLRTPPGIAPALLNDVDEDRALVSHSLCRYDCAPSLRYARALLAELARVDDAAAERFSGELVGLVIMLRRDGGLRLAPSGEIAADTFRYDHVTASRPGPRTGEWRDVLRRGNALAIHPTHASVLRAGFEIHRLEIPPHDVQIRLFA